MNKYDEKTLWDYTYLLEEQYDCNGPYGIVIKKDIDKPDSNYHEIRQALIGELLK